MIKRVSNEKPPQHMDLGLSETSRPTTMNPSLAAILGSLADGASTYNFLKSGSGVENNAMFAGSGGPAKTAMTAAGTGLMAPLLGKLLKNKLPSGLIDAIVGNMGAQSMGAAGANFDGFGESSFDQVNNSITREIGK